MPKNYHTNIEQTQYQMGHQLTRNPPWTRDEIVLALHWYRNRISGPITDHNRGVQELSSVLRALTEYPQDVRTSSFRNIPGVRKRLNYFRRLEDGETRAGAKLFCCIWVEFRERPAELEPEANTIRAREFVSRITEFSALTQRENL